MGVQPGAFHRLEQLRFYLARIKNEIRISKIIKQIPYFFLNFDPILNHREFKIAEIDDDRFEKCTILNEKYSKPLRQFSLLLYSEKMKAIQNSFISNELTESLGTMLCSLFNVQTIHT